MQKMTLMWSVGFLAAIVLFGCRGTAPVQSVENASYGLASLANEKRLTLQDYERAIVLAGSKRNWIFEKAGSGHLIGTNVIRGKHTAVVDITFTTKSFSIEYKDSKNLNYDSSEKTIHPNFNSWVELLKADIQAEIQKLRVR